MRTSIEAHWLARPRSARCPELEAPLSSRKVEGLSRATCRAIGRHSRDCPICTEDRDRIEPLALLGLAPVPVFLAHPNWHLAAFRGRSPQGIDRWDKDGFPRRRALVGRPSGIHVTALSAAGLAVVAGTILWIQLSSEPSASDRWAAASSSTTLASSGAGPSRPESPGTTTTTTAAPAVGRSKTAVGVTTSSAPVSTPTTVNAATTTHLLIPAPTHRHAKKRRPSTTTTTTTTTTSVVIGLALDSASVDLGQTATSATISFHANGGSVDWTATTSAGWLTVQPAAGTANPGTEATMTLAMIRATAPTGSLQANVTISSSAGSVSVPVTATELVSASVTGLAWWDEEREAEAALHDLESEQSILAWSLAGSLRAHLTTIERDAVLVGEHGAGAVDDRYAPVVLRPSSAPRTPSPDPSRLLLSIPVADDRVVDLGVRPGDLVDRDQRLAHQSELLLLVAPPGDSSLYSMDGRVVSSPPLRDALDRGGSTLRLRRPEAEQIGLAARTSMAGIARVDVKDLGHWSVISVASAARERDREKRAMWRLVLGVLVASGLVLLFGGAALRRQRKELRLERELAVAEVQRERDEDLLHSERVATMGTFAMGIAHEVATPLGVIIGRAEQLLAKARDDDRTTRSAQTILTQADRIQHIVRRFLDMARGGPPSLERVDPSGVARAATAAVEHRFERAGVALASDIPATMPAIQCDRDLLEQAIVNLLLNACEACGQGGRVEVTARSDAEQVVFVVIDDGAGISPENARRATEPFFTTKQEGMGTGLGLAIAAEIAKSHRGDLVIAPNADKGTRARIEIPIAIGDGHAGVQ